MQKTQVTAVSFYTNAPDAFLFRIKFLHSQTPPSFFLENWSNPKPTYHWQVFYRYMLR